MVRRGLEAASTVDLADIRRLLNRFARYEFRSKNSKEIVLGEKWSGHVRVDGFAAHDLAFLATINRWLRKLAGVKARLTAVSNGRCSVAKCGTAQSDWEMNASHNPANLNKTLAVLGIAGLSACGGIATHSSREIVAPSLPVTVEGVVFNAQAFSRWTTSEQRRVGFRSVQFIRPTRVVSKGNRVRVLPQARTLIDPSELTYTFEGRERTFDDYITQMRVAGVLVLHNGQIVLERYAAGHGPASAWTSFSVAKSVVSMLIGAALADGAIRSVDDSVTRYVRALHGSAYDGVTIRQLLQMSSGVAWNENYDDPAADVYRLPGRLGIDSLLAYMSRLPRRAPPGSVFNYNSGETEIVGEVVRAATGRSLAQYLSEKIWSPQGMEADAYWATLRQGDVEWADCCLSATLRDYGRLGLLALSDGKALNGKRLFPDGWMTEATSPSATNPDYGYLWWRQSLPGRYAAAGIYGQYIYVDPPDNVVVVIQSFWDSPTSTALNAHRRAFRDALTRDVVRHANPLR